MNMHSVRENSGKRHMGYNDLKEFEEKLYKSHVKNCDANEECLIISGGK